MLSSWFGGDTVHDANAGLQQRYSSRSVHDALTKNLGDMDVFVAHTIQMTNELKRVSAQKQAEKLAMEQDKKALEARWLQRLRCSRLESALHSGVVARDHRSAGKALKLWVEVVGLMRRETLEKRRERESQLQLGIRDSGRAELLRERSILAQQAKESALQAQQRVASDPILL